MQRLKHKLVEHFIRFHIFIQSDSLLQFLYGSKGQQSVSSSLIRFKFITFYWNKKNVSRGIDAYRIDAARNEVVDLRVIAPPSHPIPFLSLY